jgi:hypothetical protein
VYAISETNGVTEGDFLSVLAVLLVAALAASRYRNARRAEADMTGESNSVRS